VLGWEGFLPAGGSTHGINNLKIVMQNSALWLIFRSENTNRLSIENLKIKLAEDL
jgi:hypothetical protein